MTKMHNVFNVDIKLTGPGGVVGLFADKLHRDLQSLGYNVKLTDPISEGSDYWHSTAESRKKMDEIFDPSDIREMEITVEHCPWGG